MPRLLPAALFAVLSLGVVSYSSAQEDHGAHGGSMDAGQMSAASTQYMDAMKKMDGDMAAMTMTGKPGADFAAMMIPHHQAAIDMAKSYLASGDKDAELIELSNEIIAAQEREIAFLKDWIARNGS